MNIIKRLFCKHNEQDFVKNIHGDAINWFAQGNKIYRSIWKCRDCGKFIWKQELNKDGGNE